MESQEHQGNSSCSKQEKSRRGRPSRGEQERILTEQGSTLAEHFRSAPLRSPVDPQFAPYYDQVLKGDSRAILQYCDEHWHQGDIVSSFWELLGRLVTLRSSLIANVILTNIERRPVMRWPTEKETFDYWYKKLKGACQRARRFIRAARKPWATTVREEIWREYVLQPLQNVRFAHLRGQPNEESLQVEENARQQVSHRQMMEDLLARRESQTIESVRSRLRGMGLEDPALENQTISSFHLGEVNFFSPRGLVTREIFFDLARTKGSLGKHGFAFSPARVARRYACLIVGISESTSSHRTQN
jgi:hypothetical protein